MLIIKEDNIVSLTYSCDNYDSILSDTLYDLMREVSYDGYDFDIDDIDITSKSDIASINDLEKRIKAKLSNIDFTDISCEIDDNYLIVDIYTHNTNNITNDVINRITDIINEKEIEIEITVEGTTNWTTTRSLNWYEPDDYDYDEVNSKTTLYLTDYEFISMDIL